MAAVVSVLALMPQIALTSGIPITATSLGIMLCGTVLGARNGFLAVVLYLLLGLAGLPIFAGGASGYVPFTKPGAGFLIGYPIAAFVIGWLVERTTLPVGFAAGAASAIGGIAVLYAIGLPVMAWTLDISLSRAAFLCAAYLPGDVIKVVLAGLITASLAKARPGVLMSRA
nr:biotin transporter BioY [Pseudogemmobacter hezensis]